MMRDPTADELLEAVANWLNDEHGATDRFHRRLAANAIAIVRRELALWPSTEKEAQIRAAELLGRAGDARELEAALALAIRAGRLRHDAPALREHLRRCALDALAIDQPHYVHELRK